MIPGHCAVGFHYKLSWTSPIYLKSEKRYAPDGFRFVDPLIARVAYGGKCKDGQNHRCMICGRAVKSCYQLLFLGSMKEFWISDHCFRHESTQLWPEETENDKIVGWYNRMDMEARAAAGDPLAMLAMFCEEANL